MIKSIRSFCRERPSIAVLGGAIFFIMFIGVFLAFVVLIVTSKSDGLFDMTFCFSNECATDYFKKIDQSLLIIKATFDISVAIATVGGIFVALLSYFNAAGNAALTNHIEHLKVFCDYIETEIKKRERLRSSQIDALLLYGTIFSQSRSGKTTVSEDYKSFVVKLNELVQESNDRCVIGTPGGFSYKDHQRRIRDHLIAAGIGVYMAPRNDYFEMESQLFSLLHRIGQSFCPPGSLVQMIERKYY
jgi:hypothetical protein